MNSRGRKALAELGVRPSKGRGQNFLVQQRVAEKIVAAADLQSDDEVVEIGPGLGILSDLIMAHPLRRYTLVELETRLAEALRARYAAAAPVRIINADFLAIELSGIVERPPLKIIGNLPFNVAAAILQRLCSQRRLIARMVLMFQREVADRIRAVAGDDAYGALSLYTALHWQIESHFRVEAGSFHPRPKVDAEVLIMAPQPPITRAASDAQIESVVRAAFSSRRKTLRNSLANGLKIELAQAQTLIGAAGLNPQSRAEELGLEDFARLAAVTFSAQPQDGGAR